MRSRPVKAIEMPEMPTRRDPKRARSFSGEGFALEVDGVGDSSVGNNDGAPVRFHSQRRGPFEKRLMNGYEDRTSGLSANHQQGLVPGQPLLGLVVPTVAETCTWSLARYSADCSRNHES